MADKLVRTQPAADVTTSANQRPVADTEGLLPFENPDLEQSRYKFNYLVFPNDLGMDDNSHYMIININVPTRTLSDDPAGRFSGSAFNVIDPIERSKVDRLRFPSTENRSGGLIGLAEQALGQFGVGIGTGDGNRAPFTIQRKTRRIAESIALHMPTPLVFNTHNAYEEISLSNLAGRLGTGALGALFAAGGSALGSINKAIGASAAARIISSATGQVIGTAAKVLQTPINPAVEILFANTLVRQFTIEVLMAPRNEKESLTMKNIIRTMKFHAAPEINDLFGLFWIPPADFDITFYHRGKENLNILRINTCVLERIEVDYAPTGVYSTFRNGHPVAARLSLGFRELEPIHKKRVIQGF